MRSCRRPAGRLSPRPGASQPARVRTAARAERRIPAGKGGGPQVPLKGPACEVSRRKGRGRAADRSGGSRPPEPRRPLRPAPTARGMARGPALSLLCAPAVWAAAALLLCAPRSSGRTCTPVGLVAHVRLTQPPCPGRSARSAPFPARAPLPGLLPIRRTAGPVKCFQRPGGRRLGETLAGGFRGSGV